MTVLYTSMKKGAMPINKRLRTQQICELGKVGERKDRNTHEHIPMGNSYCSKREFLTQTKVNQEMRRNDASNWGVRGRNGMEHTDTHSEVNKWRGERNFFVG